MKVVNYGMFFPIQIWKYKTFYRVQPPNLLSEPNTFSFESHFADSIKNEISDNDYLDIKNNYKLVNQIWVFNPRYGIHLSRGFVHVYCINSLKYPYNTEKIFSPTVINIDLNIRKFYSGFIFIAYQFNIPNTTLLVFEHDLNHNIKRIVLSNEDQNDLNFLPSFRHKNTPFYELKFPFLYIYTYVFMEKPNMIYWKANGENYCIPSNNPKDYPTLLDCMYNNVDQLEIRDTYFQTNLKPLATLLQPPTHESINYSLPIILFTILIITIITFFFLF